MKNLIENLLGWLERGAREARRRELDRYLARSSDRADLERRLRSLELGKILK